jgi:acyl-CoA synthetase (AMP-forming)/AMP-acid ligase II
MGANMLGIPESKEPDLIPKDEFNKRMAEFFKKHGAFFSEVLKKIEENRVSWGSLVELNAEKYVDNIAIKFENTTLSYKEFNEWTNRYANFFISAGLRKGDIVELMMTNRPEFLIIVTAIGKIGAITSLINIDLRDSSLLHSLRLTLGKFIIIDERCWDAFNKVKSELDLTQVKSLFFVVDKGFVSKPEGFFDLSKKVSSFPIENPPTTKGVKTSDPITYIFTSGTTGFPKATIFAHATMVLCYYSFGHMVLELTPEDTMYVPLPLFHSNSLGVGCATTFGGGAAIALGRKFSVTNFWDDIRKYNATAFNYIGEVCRYLINQPVKPDDADNPIKMVIGAGLRPEIWIEFKQRFNIPKIAEYYSATEAVGYFANILNFDCTVGICTGSYAIVKFDPEKESPIRNEEGFMERVDINESGLLLFEIGPAVFRGYTDKDATNAKLFHNVLKEGDTWFNTGDLMKDIGNNHAQFVDRLGDTFRWKGHNISTTEVERIINKFDQVSFSTVYGVRIPGTDGRAGMAAIVPNTSTEDFDLKGLADHLTQNLPSYGVPIFLRLKSELTTTATFKLKKVKLKKEGFEIEITDDPMYVISPDKLEYTPLVKEIYENIQNQNYDF